MLWEAHPELMSTSLSRHDELMRRAVGDASGYVFKTIGDAFCAAFATAPDAVAAVLAAQLAFQAEPWPEETPIKVRTALHTGAVEGRDDDYFGPPLNRVARLMAAGHGGQALLSSATQELIRDSLPDGCSLKPLGEHRLKDLGRPETVFQLCHPGLHPDFPPLRSLDSLPNNLPQQVTSFIGREKEVTEVRALLEKSRLVTLTGSGGSGKTRLALQAAAEILDGSGDGVWLVELAALTDPGLVPQTVANVLGLREEAGKSLTQSLAEHLKSKFLLLVLDNCEHLLDACASLADALLRNCPNVLIVATSREGLGIAGETTYRVPSLSLPDPTQPQTPESLSHYESVRLFIERAVQVKTGFNVTKQSALALASICHRLDGIPLAIELAAARVRSLTVEEVNQKLDQRFRLLTGGSRTALPRQQTLRSLIDWSYDLLNESEKAILCRLSVFSGGWTLEAAEKVCSGGVVEEWEALDLLTSLADKSLVVAEQRDGVTRYRLLETVRQYARDRLLEIGEGETWRDKHLAYFLELGEESEPHLAGAQQQTWLDRLEREHDNIRAALEWSSEVTDPGVLGLRLAGAIWRFWAVRGYLLEGRACLAGLLDAVQSTAAGAVRTKALNGAGVLAYEQGDYAAARTLHEESLGIRRELGDWWGIAESLNSLGILTYQQGDLLDALALYEESLAIRWDLGDRRGIAMSLNNLGNLAYEQGDYPTARAHYEESLTMKRELGDRRGIAISLNNLGNLAYDQGDYPAAWALYEESLAISRELGNRWGIAMSLNNLGNLAYDQGDYPAARTLYDESLAIKRELGDRPGVAESLEGLASFAALADPSRAARMWGAAEKLREDLGASLPPNERLRYERHVGAAPTDDAAFQLAWLEGRAMTLELAIEYALEEPNA